MGKKKTERKLNVGDKVKFLGYSEEIADPLFEAGQELQVVTITEDGIGCVPYGADPETAEGDEVYTEELEFISSTTEEATEEAPEEEEQPKAKKSAVKSKKTATKAKAEAKAKEEEPAEELSEEDKLRQKIERKAERAANKLAKAEQEIEAMTKGELQTYLEEQGVEFLKKDTRDTLVERALDTLADLREQSELTYESYLEEQNGPTIEDSDTVKKLLKGKDPLDVAKALATQHEEIYFNLGGILHKIRGEGHFCRAGYEGHEGFAEYVEQELGIQYRKAMYLIDIYTKFRALGVDEKRLSEIGWSKAKEIAKVATTENFDELVDFAKDNSRNDLIEHIREETVDAGTGEGGSTDTRARKVRLSFNLFQDQADTVLHAIDAAKSYTGSDEPEQALEYICGEWSINSDGVELDRDEMIRYMENKFNITISFEERNAQQEEEASEEEEEQAENAA